MTRRGYPTQDGQRAAEVVFADVLVAPHNVLGAPDGAAPIIERAVSETIAALSAEAVGAMSEALAMTRSSISRPASSSASRSARSRRSQHRAADMTVALEQARTA